MTKLASSKLTVPGKHWWRAPLTYLAAFCFILAVVFARLASEVMERETGSFDKAVRSLAARHHDPTVVSFFGVVTQLGAWYSIAIMAVLLAVALGRRRARVQPLLVAIAPFGGSLVIYALKGYYRVDRPNIGSALTFSFPSGHTSGSTAFAIVAAYLLTREGVIPAAAGWTIAIAMPVLVGMSRIVLDMHWGSDVVGGWLIGAAYATAVCALYELARPR